ncbi:hypothetical protein HSHS1_14260 [Helicobacter suis HS1]|nr:hypothetical protein [Helicobacter suis]BDR28665.1 hypothetical protein HSHS1_14260 [Helicobacter suis HS1]
MGFLPESLKEYALIKKRHKIAPVSWAYLPEVLIKMGVGGVSTQGLKSLWLANKENLRACRENGIKANLLTMLLRYPYKIKGLLRAKLSVWN